MRAHVEITEADVSSGCSAPQGNGKAHETPPDVPNNDMVASGSTEEHNHEDNADHCGEESTQDQSRENAVNSDLESASGDCLTCLDTDDVAVRTAQKRFQKKV